MDPHLSSSGRWCRQKRASWLALLALSLFAGECCGIVLSETRQHTAVDCSPSFNATTLRSMARAEMPTFNGGDDGYGSADQRRNCGSVSTDSSWGHFPNLIDTCWRRDKAFGFRLTEFYQSVTARETGGADQLTSAAADSVKGLEEQQSSTASQPVFPSHRDFRCRHHDVDTRQILRCEAKRWTPPREEAVTDTATSPYHVAGQLGHPDGFYWIFKMDFELEGGIVCRIHTRSSTSVDLTLEGTSDKRPYSFAPVDQHEYGLAEIGIGLCQALGYPVQVIVKLNPFAELIESYHRPTVNDDRSSGEGSSFRPPLAFSLAQLGFRVAARHAYLPGVEQAVLAVSPFRNRTRTLNDSLLVAGVHSVSEWSSACWLGIPADPKSAVYSTMFHAAVSYFSSLTLADVHSPRLTGHLADVFLRPHKADQDEASSRPWQSCQMSDAVVGCLAEIRQRYREGLIPLYVHNSAVSAIYGKLLQRMTADRVRVDEEWKETGRTAPSTSLGGAFWKNDAPTTPTEACSAADRKSGAVCDMERVWRFDSKKIEKYRPTDKLMFFDVDKVTFDHRDDVVDTTLMHLLEPCRFSPLNKDPTVVTFQRALWSRLWQLLRGRRSGENVSTNGMDWDVENGAAAFIDPTRSDVFWEYAARHSEQSIVWPRILNILGRVFVRQSAGFCGADPLKSPQRLGPASPHHTMAVREQQSVSHVHSAVETHAWAPTTDPVNGAEEVRSSLPLTSPGKRVYAADELFRALDNRHRYAADAARRREVFFSTYNFGHTRSERERHEKEHDIDFTVTGVPVKKKETGAVNFKCSYDDWPMRGHWSPWVSKYRCEVAFVNKPDIKAWTTGMRSHALAGHYERSALIGIEFERDAPHRCEIAYLGNEAARTVSRYSGRTALKLGVSLCTIHGFSVVTLTDDSYDIGTQAVLRHVSAVETGSTYYGSSGFELNGDVSVMHTKNQTCSAAGFGLDNAVSGTCHFGDVMVIRDAFDKRLLNDELAARARRSLYDLRLDCNDPVWTGCGDYYSLMQQGNGRAEGDGGQNAGGNCRFETEEEYRYLSQRFPDECGFGERVGLCRRRVRRALPCRRLPETVVTRRWGDRWQPGERYGIGCHLLDWLDFRIVRPDDPAGKLHQLMRSLSDDLAIEALRSPVAEKEAAWKPVQAEGSVPSGGEAGPSELTEVRDGTVSSESDKTAGAPVSEEGSGDWSNPSTAADRATSLLESSVVFLTATTTQSFWQRLETKTACRPAGAWHFLRKAITSYELAGAV